MDGFLTPEQQAALDALGVTKDQFVLYHARRIDGRYLTHAMACLLAYDFLLTLGDEVEYIWKTTPRFSVAKGMWFLNRYWSLASVCVRVWAMAYASPPPITTRLNMSSSCNVAIQFTAWSGIVNIAIVDILLMLRVWALYNGSRFVKWILIGVFTVGFPMAVGLRKAPPITGLPLVTPAPDSLTVCHRSLPTELFSLFTMGLVIDTIIFGMLVYKAGGRKFRSQTPVFSVLIRDGALYYAFITAVLVFLIAATFIPALYQPVADANLNIPLSTLACNRLILSLRGVYFRRGEGGAHSGLDSLATSYHPQPHHSIRFEGADRYVHTARSPNLRNDFQLGALRSPCRRVHHQLRSMGSDWDHETDNTGAEVESVSPASASGHSSIRSFAGRYPDRGSFSQTLSPTSGVQLYDQVTVTRTKQTVSDDGVEFDLAVEDEGTSMAERDRGPTKDWWDSGEGGAVQGAATNAPSPRPGVYESRVGYRDRIPEELEERFASHRSPGSL